MADNLTHLKFWQRPPLDPVTGNPTPMPPGTWTHFPKSPPGAEPFDREYNATICCPMCGNLASLPHAVSPTGVVTPSAVCPNHSVVGINCTWHEWIVLDGWAEHAK